MNLDDPTTPQPKLSRDEVLREIARCDRSCLYFAHTYIHIYDKRQGVSRWTPFRLWRAQAETLKTLGEQPLTIILKARQIGLTWLVLSRKLWRMIFRPQAQVSLLSLRDDEAVYLLHERMRGMFLRLPEWMKPAIVEDSKHILSLANGSTARAFSTRAGDSYAATDVVVDEADLVPDLDRLLRSNAPTIDGGGELTLLSRSNKSSPLSPFKGIWRAAESGSSSYYPIFLPWSVHPDRDTAWYERQCADSIATTGSLDAVHEQYPSTAAEAISAATLDKRFPHEWLSAVSDIRDPLVSSWEVSLEVPRNLRPILRVYEAPQKETEYVCGVDPAAGLQSGDDTAAVVKERASGRTVAVMVGKIECGSELPERLDELARYYSTDKRPLRILIERNNHGHATLTGLRHKRGPFHVESGSDGQKGYQTTAKSKAVLFDEYAAWLRLAARVGRKTLFDRALQTQLALIDRDSLAHPDKKRGAKGVDDLAVAEVLAHKARRVTLDESCETDDFDRVAVRSTAIIPDFKPLYVPNKHW